MFYRLGVIAARQRPLRSNSKRKVRPLGTPLAMEDVAALLRGKPLVALGVGDDHLVADQPAARALRAGESFHPLLSRPDVLAADDAGVRVVHSRLLSCRVRGYDSGGHGV